MQIYVNTRNPNVRSVKDFTAADKIALPAVKVSVNAVLLQMAAEQAFGPDQHGKLDPLTVTQSYAEGNVSILAGRSEINSTFAASPFHERQLKTPGIHTVLKSYDVLGGPATNNLIWTTKKFHDANPKVYAAYLAAFEEAIQFIKSNKKQAATLYRDITGDKSSSEEELIVILNDPNLDYTTTPMNIQKYADFMQKIGTIKAKPKSWKDLFFSEIHDKPGS
jgi:NitT/TauT family transport system substrate-binding protein